MSSFTKFEGQTSKNVDDVRKVCLEITFCVYACFVDFYVSVLDEIDVGGPKLISDHVWVGNIRANIPKDHLEVLEEGSKVGAKTVQDSPTNGWQSTPSGSVDAPLVRCSLLRLING